MATVKQRVATELETQKLMLELAEVKRKYKELMKQNRGLQRDIVLVEGLKENYRPHTIKRTHTKGGEATAVMVFSDLHLEEEITLASVSGLNRYNVEIAKHRAEKFFQHALTLLNICQRDVTINNIVLALLGDFISNSIHEELVEVNQLLPADAIWEAQNILTAGIQFLLDNTKCNLTIPCVVGN